MWVHCPSLQHDMEWPLHVLETVSTTSTNTSSLQPLHVVIKHDDDPESAGRASPMPPQHLQSSTAASALPARIVSDWLRNRASNRRRLQEASPARARVHRLATDFGADQTGLVDATPASARALAEAWANEKGTNSSKQQTGLAGVTIELKGGTFGVSRPVHRCRNAYLTKSTQDQHNVMGVQRHALLFSCIQDKILYSFAADE